MRVFYKLCANFDWSLYQKIISQIALDIFKLFNLFVAEKDWRMASFKTTFVVDTFTLQIAPKMRVKECSLRFWFAHVLCFDNQWAEKENMPSRGLANGFKIDFLKIYLWPINADESLEIFFELYNQLDAIVPLVLVTRCSIIIVY